VKDHRKIIKQIIVVIFFLTQVGYASAQIINIEDRRTAFDDSIAWHERVDLGLGLVHNTKNIFTLNGGAQIEFQHHDKLFLSLTKFKFVKAGEENFVNEGFQHLRYNQNIKHWLVYELFGQLQYNEKVRIRLRGLVGSGLRFLVLDKKKQKAYIGISYMYEYDEESKSLVIHHDQRASSYLSANIKLKDYLSFASTSYYQPLFNDFSDYRLSSESSLIFNISKRLNFKTTFSITYDSRLPEEVPNTIYSMTNGLRYVF